MLLYPAFLKLENIKCLVIGGGKIAERKTISLLSSGANISLISPDITLQLKVLVIWLVKKKFNTMKGLTFREI